MLNHPIIDLDRGWRRWYIDEIYTGANGTGSIVPNVDDYVWSWSQGELRCTAIDLNTGLSTLVEWVDPAQGDANEAKDIIMGSVRYHAGERYRLYVDDATVPSTGALDSCLYIRAHEATHIRVFKGIDITNNGLVISKKIDANNNITTDKINLLTTEINDKVYSTPESFHVTETLNDADVCTVVVYNTSDTPISTQVLTVVKSTLMLKDQYQQRYVTDINVVSPYINVTTGELQVPINLPVDSLGLVAEISYNSGLKALLPIDGTRCTIHGLSRFVASVPDITLDLVLTYRLADNESSISVTSRTSRNVTKELKLRTLPATHLYNIKLFAYPRWDGARYYLQYWLANLEREEVIDVTEHVIDSSVITSSFNPNLFGVKQDLTVSLLLSDVSEAYAGYRHVQPISVTLNSIPNITTASPWTMTLSSDPAAEVYGNNAGGKFWIYGPGTWRINVDANFTSEYEWLSEFYSKIYPLHDSVTETDAVTPSHFEIEVRGTKQRLPVAAYDTDITISHNLIMGELVNIHWIKETASNDLYLGMSSIPMKQV